MAYTIKVTIDEEGNVSFDVHGIKGPGCTTVLKPFEQLGQVVEEHKKPEYFQAEVGITTRQQ